ncbi:hypothetical protein B0H63DRAFT_523215 [Podospora didyma]|uniref:Uncharacterized protein n=1 Tax=Podospora didyma TaxID=330526 RepID=A0AAE0NQN5_9PEZI|nr:hypothetical protein B0H63DRAFT_523215 [Podospora didyma]
MGQNLSMPPVDTSGVKLSPQDRNSQIILGVTWLCCIYGIGMIFTAIKLMTRWAGPHGEKDVGFVSVLVDEQQGH